MTFAISVQRSTNWANKLTGSWSAVHRYDFHKFTAINYFPHGFIWNQYNDQLQGGIHDSQVKCFPLSLFALNTIGKET